MTGVCAGPTWASSVADARSRRGAREELGQRRGVGVAEIAAGSPAERAGLRPTDTILAVEDAATEDAGDLQRALVSDMIGRTVRLRVLRGGDVLDVDVVPAELG